MSVTVGLPEIDRQENAIDDELTAHLEQDGRILCGAPLNGPHARSCTGKFREYTGERFCPFCGRPVCAYCRLLADTIQTATPTRRRWWKRGRA